MGDRWETLDESASIRERECIYVLVQRSMQPPEARANSQAHQVVDAHAFERVGARSAASVKAPEKFSPEVDELIGKRLRPLPLSGGDTGEG